MKVVSLFFGVVVLLGIGQTYSDAQQDRTSVLQSGVAKVGDTIAITGEITPAIAEKFSSLIDAGTKSVVIKSGGGDDLSAIQIGQQVRDRNLVLIIDSACMSACAHFIFLPAKKRVVRPLSLVVFHNTSESMLKLIGEKGKTVAKSFLGPRAQAERKYFENAGISERILLQPQLEVKTSCFQYAYDRNNSFREVQFAAYYAGWIPSLEFLKANGIAVEGFWPRSQEDLRGAWLAVFTGPIKPALRFGGPPSLLPIGEINARYAQIKECGSASIQTGDSHP